MLHVPYRGTGPQLTDLLAGRLDAASVGAPAVMQFIKAGKLRCIATGTTTRLPQLPDVPTVAEQGFPGFEMTQWYGLMAPASLPQAAADKLAAAAAKAMREPVALEHLAKDAAIGVGSSPTEFASFIAAEQKALAAGDRARQDQARLIRRTGACRRWPNAGWSAALALALSQVVQRAPGRGAGSRVLIWRNRGCGMLRDSPSQTLGTKPRERPAWITTPTACPKAACRPSARR